MTLRNIISYIVYSVLLSCFLLDACWGAYIKFYLGYLKH